jgi:hypothetical protein
MSTENETPSNAEPVSGVAEGASGAPATAPAPETTQEQIEKVITGSGADAVGEGMTNDELDKKYDKSAPNLKVTVDSPIIKDFPTGKEFPLARLAILMATAEEFRDRAATWKNLQWGTDTTTEKWLDGLKTGMIHFNEGDALIKTLDKELADYHQSVDVGDAHLNIATTRIGDVESGRRLTGEMAQVRMTQALRLGAMVTVPLWHSGIWVTLKAPSETDLLTLEDQLIAEKTTLGRNTGGRTHSVQGVYAMSRVVDAILASVYEASTESFDPGYLKKRIKVTDLHPLVLGFLSAIYPGGYPLSRVCITDPSKCKFVTEEVINLPRLLFMDRSALTEKQKAHMRRRNSRFTDKELDAYQAEHAFNKTTTVELNDHTKITLKVPSLEEAEISGREWIDDITTLIDSQAREALDDNARDRRIMEMSVSQAARQYAHWVERITLDSGLDSEGEFIEERKDVASMIGMISGNDDYEDSFYKGIESYITKSTIALVAIPNYKCPKCKGSQQTKEEAQKHPQLIALDTVQTFFTLLAQRVAKIRARRLA